MTDPGLAVPLAAFCGEAQGHGLRGAQQSPRHPLVSGCASPGHSAGRAEGGVSSRAGEAQELRTEARSTWHLNPTYSVLFTYDFKMYFCYETEHRYRKAQNT